MNPVVYIAIAPGGACYVGVTSQPPSKRWRFHVNTARRGTSACKRLAAAIREHGMTEANFRVIRECASLDEAKVRERKLVADFKPALNMTRGGDCRPPHTPESRAKMSAARKGKTYCRGRKLSAEHRALIGQAHLGNQYRLGTVQPADVRAKISASLRASAAAKAANASRVGVPRPEHAARMSGRKASAETRAKMSASQRARHALEAAK